MFCGMAVLIFLYFTTLYGAASLTTGSVYVPKSTGLKEMVSIKNPTAIPELAQDGTPQNLVVVHKHSVDSTSIGDSMDTLSRISRGTRALSLSFRPAKASSSIGDIHRSSRLQRRGGCLSIDCFEDPDMKLMKNPLPNPPLARTPSEARIAESPFSKVGGRPISRNEKNINQELNRQYTVFEKTASNNWAPGMSREEPISSSDLSQDIVDRATRNIELERYRELPRQPKSRYASPRRRRMDITETSKWAKPRWSSPRPIRITQQSSATPPARSPKVGGLPVKVDIVDKSKSKPDFTKFNDPRRQHQPEGGDRHTGRHMRGPQLGKQIRNHSLERGREPSSSRSPSRSRSRSPQHR